MFATSPPGSTTAARLVAVQATIEQFCWIGVTGTMLTLSGCMNGFKYAGPNASYRKPVLAREVFQRRLGPRAEMLDHFGCRECAEPRRGPVVFAARKSDEKTCREQIARAGGIHELVDRRRAHGLVAVARDN